MELMASHVAVEKDAIAHSAGGARTFDLSIVIVSYNTRALLEECLRSIERTVQRHSCEVLVVDNGSHDGSPELVRRIFPNLSLIALERNLGFSSANNVAIRRAHGRHVLILNSDTVVLPGAVDQLVAFLDERPECGVAAPQLLNSDLSDQGTARAFPTAAAAIFGRRSILSRTFPNNRWTRRYLIGRDHRGQEPFPVDWVSGACLMVREAAIARVGLLDEGYFMHWEDADWCRRIKRSGYEVHCVPAARVVHHEGSSRAGWPARQVWVFHQSAFRYYARHHLGGWRAVLRPPAAAGLAARAALIIGGNVLVSGRRQRPTDNKKGEC